MSVSIRGRALKPETSRGCKIRELKQRQVTERGELENKWDTTREEEKRRVLNEKGKERRAAF